VKREEGTPSTSSPLNPISPPPLKTLPFPPTTTPRVSHAKMSTDKGTSVATTSGGDGEAKPQPQPQPQTEAGGGAATATSGPPPARFPASTPEEAWKSLINTGGWMLSSPPERIYLMDGAEEPETLTPEELETRVRPPSRFFFPTHGGLEARLEFPSDTPTVREVAQIVYDYHNTPMTPAFFRRYLHLSAAEAKAMAREVRDIIAGARGPSEAAGGKVFTVLDFDPDHQYIEGTMGTYGGFSFFYGS
jgi:hypothetical protein